MARSKLSFPEHFHFTAIIPIRITDLNYGGHVGNDAVLSLIHEARSQFLKHHNYTEMNLEGIGLIMNDVTIEFKSEIFYGDVLNVFVAPKDFTRVSFDLYYKLTDSKTEKNFALAKTGMVCYDYASKKVVSVPEKARTALLS